MKKYKVHEVVKFKHGRSKGNVKSLLSHPVFKSTQEELEAERFDGTVSFTSLGIIVGSFDGENQRMIIVNGDQSGRREVLTVYGPVDSPLTIGHVVAKGWFNDAEKEQKNVN